MNILIFLPFKLSTNSSGVLSAITGGHVVLNQTIYEESNQLSDELKAIIRLSILVIVCLVTIRMIAKKYDISFKQAINPMNFIKVLKRIDSKALKVLFTFCYLIVVLSIGHMVKYAVLYVRDRKSTK